MITPAITTLLEGNPDLKDIVKLVAITPIVNLLKLHLMFPDAPTHNLPPPWKDFIERAQSSLNSWVRRFPLPTDYEGMLPEVATRELALIFRYFLRNAELRNEYLIRLRSNNQIPIKATVQQHLALSEILRSVGITREEIDMLLIHQET
jgi:hypothetical protein